MIKIKNDNNKNKFDGNEFMNNVKNFGLNDAKKKMGNVEDISMLDSSQNFKQQEKQQQQNKLNNEFTNKNDQNKFDNKNDQNKNNNKNSKNKNNNNFK